jgi:hypothetical protein
MFASRARLLTTFLNRLQSTLPLGYWESTLSPDSFAFSNGQSDMKTYAIAAIPGDGIGTEVVSAGV